MRPERLGDLGKVEQRVEGRSADSELEVAQFTAGPFDHLGKGHSCLNPTSLYIRGREGGKEGFTSASDSLNQLRSL